MRSRPRARPAPTASWPGPPSCSSSLIFSTAAERGRSETERGTETETNRNGDEQKRRRTETETNRNGDEQKRKRKGSSRAVPSPSPPPSPSPSPKNSRGGPFSPPRPPTLRRE